ncbi:CBS domain-containing protein [bacterium]|nr:CBS domain-containing protein [bacterium]
MEANIKNIFSRRLVTIKADATLAEANDMMNNYNIRHLPVTDEKNTLVGLLSKSDFIALKYADSKMTSFKVKDVMSSPVKAVHKTATVKEVAKLFLNKKISSVLIVENDEAIGIVTTDDLIRLLADNVDFLNEAEQLDLASLADEGWISSTQYIS